ncbi:hypothetical protein HF289_00460 [Acidithiobacillus ferrooxidans]|uniref:hypothetical protein n=1 Tax=Acidithiobacillus ferrooxidans TaxID=920 RepID=UPI001C070E5F|nr:hypothetical protein [Acidithiobacillus ferrooxidans]MBU2855400.1 hypothetical protein [Acidithiobacillus ferrooxidans]
MSVENKDPFADISDEDMAMMGQCRRMHINVNVRNWIVASLLLIAPMLARHFWPTPWYIWVATAMVCWPTGMFIGGIVV